MTFIPNPIALSPSDFELAVKGILDGAGITLSEYESSHLESISGTDGEYVIDVTVRFSALGADFLVLIECKCEKRKTERQDVQVLHSKMQAIGGQKGMLFSTGGFQQGAIEYGDVHGIALVQIANGDTTWFTRSIADAPKQSANWFDIPKYVGWWHHGNTFSVMSETYGTYTRRALGIDPPVGE